MAAPPNGAFLAPYHAMALFKNLCTDRKTEAGPGDIVCPMQTFKYLEDLLARCFGNAWAIVIAEIGKPSPPPPQAIEIRQAPSAPS